MYTRIVGEFRMKGRSHRFGLTHNNGIASFSCEYFHFGSYALDLGRADENHFNRSSKEKTFSNRAVNLSPISVAPNADINCSKPNLVGIFNFFRQQNRAGACSKGRLQTHEFFELRKSGLAKKLQEGAGLSTRNNQTIKFVELIRFFDEHNVSAEFFQSFAVSVEIALQSENSDFDCAF